MVLLPSGRDKFPTENQCLRLGGGVNGWKGQRGNHILPVQTYNCFVSYGMGSQDPRFF